MSPWVRGRLARLLPKMRKLLARQYLSELVSDDQETQMSKIIKVFLFVVFPLFLVLGGAYGLAKVGVIPVKKLVAKNRMARLAVRFIGLDSPTLPAVRR